MFEGLKRKIAHYLIRKKYLRKNVQQEVFTNIISNSRDLLFVMPRDDKDFSHSLEILKYYQIHKKVITVFLPDYKYSLVPDKEKYKIISYVPVQVTKFNLPDKILRNILSGKEYDVVLDLNRGEDVFSSAVSNLVKSRIRISFEKELSGSYYTMQIRDKSTNPEISYRNLLTYLKMF